MAEDPLRTAFGDDDEEMSAAQTAMLGKIALKDVFVDPTPEEEREAFIRQGQEQITGEKDPGLEARRQELAANPEAAKDIADIRKDQGEGRGETMGALLSLILPVLAGAALGGKRGALHASVGAGKGRLKVIDQEREDAKELEAAAARRAEKKADREAAQDDRKDLAEFKAGLGGNSKEDKLAYEEEKKRRLNKVDREDAAAQEADDARFITAQMGDILQEAEVVYGDNSFLNKKLRETFDQASPEALLKDRIIQMTFDIVKLKQGSRPSDYDVQALLQTVRGNQLTGPEGALARLRQLKKDMDLFIKIKEEIRDSGKVSDATQKAKDAYDTRQEKNKADPDVVAVLALARQGKNKEAIKAQMEQNKIKMTEGIESALTLVFGDE